MHWLSQWRFATRRGVVDSRGNGRARWLLHVPHTERDGEWADHTEWFNVTVFSRQAETLAERLTKGTQNLEPIGLAVAADGSAWYTDAAARAIAHISRSGDISTFLLSTPIAKLGRLAVAPDGAVWFAESTAYSITRLQDSVFTRYTLESVRGGPYGVAVAADGTVWATLQSANTLVRITPDGTMTELDVPTHASAPTDIAAAASDTVWFLEFRANKIGTGARQEEAVVVGGFDGFF